MLRNVNCSLIGNGIFGDAGRRDLQRARLRPPAPLLRPLLMLMFLAANAIAQRADPSSPSPASPPQTKTPPDPALVHRPPPKTPAEGVVAKEGEIHLDVVVADASGKPVAGLEPWDFRLLDNGQQRKILSFHSFDGAQVKPSPPVQVILLMDMANLPFQQVAFVRGEIARYLNANDGRLQQPVSLFLLSDAGLRIQPQPSLDGHALLAELNQVKGGISTINAAMGSQGMLERFQRSVRELTRIAQNESQRPGRKLLIWIGPGWPMLNGSNYKFTEKDQRRFFDGIVELSTQLREARIALYSLAPVDVNSTGASTFLYQQFLKDVETVRQADAGNLALKVLVVQSGGRILGPDNDLVGQIESCVREANMFYSISFDPPNADHADEFHGIKLQMSRPDLTARTRSGYYNQP